MHRQPHGGTMNRQQQQQQSRTTTDSVHERKNSQFRRYTSIAKLFIFTRYGLITIVGLFVVVFNEFFMYEYARFHWPNIDYLDKKSGVERILLVADPQLIGEKDEGLFGLITRRDADRYLSKTFSQAKRYVRPDWTLFLGDIFDEGLSATDEEYKRYFDRFDSIFQYSDKQKSLVIPGDNDVGGEYFGDKQPILRQRFRNYFGRTIALYHHNDIDFLKLDIDMIESYAGGKQGTILDHTQRRPLTAIFRIILNHWSLIAERSTRFIKPLVEDLDPNLVIKGDSHHFSVSKYNRLNGTNRMVALDDSLSESVLILDLNKKLFVYEISVPTCSYRMGVDRIGYGVLLLDSSTKFAHLTVLWTPQRYISLFIYAAYGIFVLLVLLVAALISRRTMMKWSILLARVKLNWRR